MRWAGRLALWRTVFDVWAVFFFTRTNCWTSLLGRVLWCSQDICHNYTAFNPATGASRLGYRIYRCTMPHIRIPTQHVGDVRFRLDPVLASTDPITPAFLHYCMRE